jgi:tryptophan halogenase
MMKPVRSILVLGGGSAGFLAAISLRVKLPHLKVRVLRSKDIPIIGVGEGTTAAIIGFLHGYLALAPARFYRDVNPIWKLGIRYLWGPRSHFNFTFGPQMTAGSPLPRPLGYYLDDDIAHGSIDSSLMDHDRAFQRDPKNGQPFVGRRLAYHLENKTFVSFLERVAAEDLNVEIIDDTVTSVEQNEHGVERMQLASGRTETADVFVDCSGFASVLLGRALQEPFISYSPSLFCDRAVVGGWQRGMGELIQPYTVAETMDAGWCWRIDHEHQINRGYVYSSAFISDQAAEEEFRRKNPKIRQARVVKFRTGRYRRTWVKNVVAIGNAGGFVEPLEATAIAAICEQAKGLVAGLSSGGGRFGASVADVYNDRDARYWDSIRRFLAVPYKFNTRLETPFWREAREKTDLAGAEPIVDFYRECGPDGSWAQSLIDPLDQFGMEGYLTMLVGQRVPYEARHEPAPRERAAIEQLREKYRREGSAGYRAEQALSYIRSPHWEWDPKAFTN